MRYSIYILLVFSVTLFACAKKDISTSTTPSKAKTETITPSQYIKITAKDLSEDATLLSSKNDELILLMYSKLDRDYPELIVSEYFIMDKIDTPKKFKINSKIGLKEDFILVLLEMDTKQTLQQIEPIVRLNLNLLLTDYNQKKRVKTQELLGDDDLLTIQKSNFKNFVDNGMRAQGIHMLDAYDYILEVE